MASGLSKKVAEIEGAVQALGHFYDQLRCFQPTMGGLLESACARLPFLPWLTGCRDAMRQGEPFPPSWRGALERWPGALGREELELLASLGGVLGVTDLDSQLTALDFAREQMGFRLEQARRDREKNQKLYSTLGVLIGAGIAIILI